MRFIYDDKLNVLTDTRKVKYLNLSALGDGKSLEKTLNDMQETIEDLETDVRQLNAMLNDTESQLIYQLEKLAAALKARGRG